MRKDTGGPVAEIKAWWGWVGELRSAYAELDKAIAAATAAGGTERLAPGGEKEKKTKEAVQDYERLSSALVNVRGRLAEFGGEEVKIAFETGRMRDEVAKAAYHLANLQHEGKVTGEVFKREMGALRDLPAAIQELAAAQTREIEQRRSEAIIGATVELQGRLSGLAEQTYAHREAALGREIELLRRKMAAEKTLTEENARLLADIEEAGLHRIAMERAVAFARELQVLQQHLAQIITARMTTGERLAFQYDQDLERYSEVEEQKALVVAKTEGEIDAIRQQFGLNRKAALEAYAGELNALRNSQGWQGVFGEEFAQAIRGNEALLRAWAESADQSLLMVAVAVEGTAQTFQRGFQGFSRAMGANIAQAIVYRESIGEAMRAAAASAMQAIAAESLVNAIYATGLGFLRLAQHNYPAATAAFQAAAIFGSVGVVAAVTGRAMAPQQAGGGGAGGGAERSVSGQAGAEASSASGERGGGPRVAIYIQGNLVGRSGVDELIDIMNEAVQDRDVRLVATQVKQAGRSLR
jgi:hypothetical protein